LPFDLEYTFSSAFVLIIVSSILPSSSQGKAYNGLTYRDTITSILDDMILKGSVPAKFRTIELEELDRMFSQILTKDHPAEVPHNPPQETQKAESDIHAVPPELLQPEYPMLASEIYLDWGPDWQSLDESHVLSPLHMLSVADILGSDTVSGFEPTSLDGWLYGDVGLPGI
jgi:hypothetical protein